MAAATREVVLVVGPGGVGKTTVAAALGLRAAARGRKPIVVTIDPSRRLAQALGIAAGGEGGAGSIVRVPEPNAPPLDCLLLDTRRVFDEIVRRCSPDAAAARRMLENPIYQATVTHLGGALEYAATAQVHMLHTEHEYDLVILDTPPTANAIDFLEAPEQIVEVANNPAARFLAGSGKLSLKFLGLASGVMLRAFEAIGGGRLIGDLGRFLGDFGEILAEFQRRAGHVADLLVSPKTGVVLTTAATDFSVREALAFLDVLRERGLRVDGVVLNRVDPMLPPAPPPELLRAPLRAQLGVAQADAILPELVAVYADVRRQADRARAVQHELESRVPDLPICVLPRIDPPPTSLAELLEMGTALWG